jgi:predicted aminopeptidase
MAMEGDKPTGVTESPPPALVQPKRRQKPAWLEKKLAAIKDEAESKQCLSPSASTLNQSSLDLFSRSRDTHAQILKEKENKEKRLRDKKQKEREERRMKEKREKKNFITPEYIILDVDEVRSRPSLRIPDYANSWQAEHAGS